MLGLNQPPEVKLKTTHPEQARLFESNPTPAVKPWQHLMRAGSNQRPAPNPLDSHSLVQVEPPLAACRYCSKRL